MEVKENNLDTFLDKNPFICTNCYAFSIRNKGFCEICGSWESLRKTRIKDVEEYKKKRELYLQDQWEIKSPISKPLLNVSPLKSQENDQLPLKKSKKEEVLRTQTLSTELEDSNSKSFKEPIIEKEPSKLVQEEKIPLIINKKERFPNIIPTEQKQKILPNLKKSHLKSPKKPFSKTLFSKLKKANKISTISKENEETESNLICSFCKMKLAPTDSFCPRCGYVLKLKK